MNYTVNLLFVEDLSEVLLLYKDKTIYKNKWNGVGGKSEIKESPCQCAIREIQEETGVSFDSSELVWLGRLKTPEDCLQNSEFAIIDFFAATVEKDHVLQQPGEAEELRWFSVQNLLDLPISYTVGYLAGDGDLSYFIYYGRKLLQQRSIAK